MSHFRGTWQSLNFYKEYLFGFETLVFATSEILSAQSACNTPKRKLEITLYYPFKTTVPLLPMYMFTVANKLNTV